MLWAHIISHLNEKEILVRLYEKELQTIERTKLRIEKVIKKKGNRLYFKWKGYENLFNTATNKKDILWNILYKRWVKRSAGNVQVELDISNYAAKTDLKGVTGIDTSKLAAKSGLASMKGQVDKLDVYKQETVPADES